MSPEAHAISARYFPEARVHLLPHPAKAPVLAGSEEATRRTVLVLGQHKPARDLDVMAAIAPSLRVAGWELTVAGRGWPPMPGWRVIDRFVEDSEFRALLDTQRVLLLPYRYYFQSGVALRALEAGVPVVGRQTGFLTSVLGDDFPGAVVDWNDPRSWIGGGRGGRGRSDEPNAFGGRVFEARRGRMEFVDRPIDGHVACRSSDSQRLETKGSSSMGRLRRRRGEPRG